MQECAPPDASSGASWVIMSLRSSSPTSSSGTDWQAKIIIKFKGYQNQFKLWERINNKWAQKRGKMIKRRRRINDYLLRHGWCPPATAAVEAPLIKRRRATQAALRRQAAAYLLRHGWRLPAIPAAVQALPHLWTEAAEQYPAGPAFDPAPSSATTLVKCAAPEPGYIAIPPRRCR
jgi:hypothetical protein